MRIHCYRLIVGKVSIWERKSPQIGIFPPSLFPVYTKKCSIFLAQLLHYYAGKRMLCTFFPGHEYQVKESIPFLYSHLHQRQSYNLSKLFWLCTIYRRNCKQADGTTQSTQPGYFIPTTSASHHFLNRYRANNGFILHFL